MLSAGNYVRATGTDGFFSTFDWLNMWRDIFLANCKEIKMEHCLETQFHRNVTLYNL